VAGDRLFWWGIEVAQKRPLWLRITTSGRGGHGSTYNPASATHQLVWSLSKLFDTMPQMRVTPAAKDYFGALARFHGNAFEQVFGSPDLARRARVPAHARGGPHRRGADAGHGGVLPGH